MLLAGANSPEKVGKNPASKRLNITSPKCSKLVFAPCLTYPENLIKIHLPVCACSPVMLLTSQVDRQK